MNDSRKHVLFFSILGMMAALFFSRALLSVFMSLFVITGLWHRDWKAHFQNFFSSPVLWSMCLLFMLPLVSGLWSADTKEWLNVIRVKLPLLLLPLAFAAPFRLSEKQWNFLAWTFIALVVAGSAWSLIQYALDVQAINESYLKAKSIPTPFGNDHVRFSWVVSITILLCAWIWWKNKTTHLAISRLSLLIMILLVVFLHLLAARTGLFSFYIILLGIAVWMLFQKAKIIYGFIILLVLVCLPVLAYYTMPSFHNRISYILYDFGHLKEKKYLPGGNDASRTISIKAGYNIFLDNQLLGVGAGDISAETKQWDIKQYPEILTTDIIYPSSEWLIYGLTAGWAGVIIFTGIMLIPFFYRKKPGLVWFLLHLTAALSFLFDMGLEVQFGVFIYAFIVLWWWKWFSHLERK